MLETVQAEYTEGNRDVIIRWESNDSAAYDWSLYFKHVVQDLEGKSVEEVGKREERMRKIVKGCGL